MGTRSYPIVEKFHSIQGEGIQAGEQAFFLRFHGCNLECVFDKTHKCDEPLHVTGGITEMTLLEIEIAARKIPTTLNVIITGGEPSIQPGIEELISFLKRMGFYVAVETNGENVEKLIHADLITYSPKVGFSKKARLIPFELMTELEANVELKLLANANKPVEVDLWDEYSLKYVQPINFESDIDMESVKYCTDFVTNNPDWKLSMQMHKVAKVQ